MSEIIQNWVHDRLGIVLNMTPEIFAEKVRDGYLLASILKSYEIITAEQLGMISETTSTKLCFANFQNHILTWLNLLGIYIDDEELCDIVDASGTAALNLFYQVYLELRSQNNLSVISQRRLNEKLKPPPRFTVERVRDVTFKRDELTSNIYDQPLRDAKDIIHWQKDKMLMLQIKCKEARDEYLQRVRNSSTIYPKTDMPIMRKTCKPEAHQHIIVPNLQDDTVSMTYEELQKQREGAVQLPKFVPDAEQSKKILKKIRIKHSEHAENLIFKTELQHDIFTSLWDKVKQDEEVRHNKVVTEAILKQSVYEKQMQRKMEEVKWQRHTMLENRRKETETISKQMSDDFVHKLILKDKQLNEKELSYYIEKERILELHHRLYEQKKKLKHEMIVKICTSMVSDLIAYACQEAEYLERVGAQPPARLRDMWKKMFVKGLPFKEHVKPIEVILKKPEDRPEDLEEIIHLEIERQESLDDEELQCYMGFQWPWTWNETEEDEKNMEMMMCALNVLGNVVHNLLLAKYPYPSLPTKQEFPNIKVSACINGIDEICLPLLQEFLNLRQILVVQVQECVNFCITAYIKQTLEIDQSVSKGDPEKKKDKVKQKGKDMGKGKGNKNEKKSQKGSKNKLKLHSDESDLQKPQFQDKMVQSPKYYPDEVIPLTPSAELGKTALEILEKGEALTKHIVAAMFIEYIKSKPDIEGWVLINFPQTYEEAAALEEILTGLPVPRFIVEDLSIIDLEELESNPETFKQKDNILEMRTSKLLPQPVSSKDPEFYDTALTAYIKPIKLDADRQPFSPTLNDIEDNRDHLDKFYANLGCNYHFYYYRLDFDATKYLAKLILGEFTVPMKSSLELFGDQMTNIAADEHHPGNRPASAHKIGEKKKKPKEKSPEKHSPRNQEQTSKLTDAVSQDKKKGKDKRAKVVVVHVNKSTQEPEVEEEEMVEPESEPEVVPQPGEKNWPYTNLPFNQELQVAYATLWENAEDVYMVDLQQVFFLKRTILNAVIPFVQMVKDHMAVFIKKADEKQVYLREFQTIYNEFDEDFRADDEFKAEMFCRIAEFRERLTEISDWKMIAADHERVFIVDRNWTATQMIQLANQYVTAMQLEIDRCVDTMMVLTDYYTSVVTKIATESVIPKEILHRLPLEHVETIKAINSLLQYVSENQEESLHTFMQKTADQCNAIVERSFQLAKADFKKAKDVLDKLILIKEREKEKKNRRKDGKKEPLPFNVDEVLVEVAQNIIDEWFCASMGEVIRVRLRIELLKKDFFTNFDENLSTIRRVFYEIYDEVRASHEKEVKSINAVCQVFSLAVEKEVRIQEELLLDREDFYVDPEVILFPDKLPLVKPLTETIRKGVFTIEQLDIILDIFLDLAPRGYMPERSFIYLLQDMIVNKDEPILVPSLWQNLEPRDLEKVAKCLFDNTEYVHWRDFIIMNLMLPFPTEKEIMWLRRCFRELDPDSTELIADYQCLDINYWFEPDIWDRLRLRRTRQLLYKMYCVKGDCMNYTALLLDFCKDKIPALGLAKALGVCMGKQVCFDREAGQHFVEMKIREMRRANIIKRREKMALTEIVKQILTDILNDLCVNYGKVKVLPSDVEIVPRYSNDDLDSLSGEMEEDEEMQDEQTQVEHVADLIYFLPEDALITVITSCLPWNARVQNIEDKSFREICEEIYESCKCSEFDNQVLCHMFLNNPRLTELLATTCRFSIRNPLVPVEEVLEDKDLEKARPKTKKFG